METSNRHQKGDDENKRRLMPHLVVLKRDGLELAVDYRLRLERRGRGSDLGGHLFVLLAGAEKKEEERERSAVS